MVGIFDSGMGGAFSLFEFRKLCPYVPVCLYADRSNLPYGTKSEVELIKLISGNIDVLQEMGAKTILMACCTASTVHSLLPEKYKSVSVPIIEPAAREAVSLSKNGKIGVLSTEATRRSGAFAKKINEIREKTEVINISAGELVELAESGARDGKLSASEREIIKKSLKPFEKSEIDALILGCTHFAYFEREIEDIMGIPIVNSARSGAREMAKLRLS